MAERIGQQVPDPYRTLFSWHEGVGDTDLYEGRILMALDSVESVWLGTSQMADLGMYGENGWSNSWIPFLEEGERYVVSHLSAPITGTKVEAVEAPGEKEATS